MTGSIEIFFFLLSLGQSYADCQNPFFNDPVLMPSGNRLQISTLPNPTIQTHFGSCSLYDGKPSCCDAATFSQIIEDQNIFDYAFHSKLTAINAVTPQQFAGALVLCFNWSMNEAQFSLLTEVTSIALGVVNPAVQCYGGFLGYFQGMLCFSCEPNWADYFNNETSILTLTHNTCNSVYQACQPFESSIQDALINIVPLIIRILQADDDPSCCTQLITELQFFLNSLKKTSICELAEHKTCQDIICQDFLRGIMIGPVEDDSPTCVEENSPLNLLGIKNPVSILKRLFSKISNIAKTTAPTTLTNISNVSNAYTNGGYDAYKTGCEPSLSTYACPVINDDKKTDWKLVAIIGGSVLGGIILIATLIIICRRRRHSEAVALDDNMERYDRLAESTDALHGQGGMIQ